MGARHAREQRLGRQRRRPLTDLYGAGQGCEDAPIARLERLTPDLAAYPDLVVVYLGMRVRRLTGLKTLLGIGPQIDRSWREQPDGLLRHENLLWSLRPPHAGMRQYWRDLDSLERWTRSEPHRRWWLDFVRDRRHGVLA